MKQKEVDTIVKLKEEAEKTQLKIIKLNKKIKLFSELALPQIKNMIKEGKTIKSYKKQ
jgi:hypothetical protein|tara:strand:- start:237 stop:410 length:174 start_codon:yes stop_codon:yes gene_type:complete